MLDETECASGAGRRFLRPVARVTVAAALVAAAVAASQALARAPSPLEAIETIEVQSRAIAQFRSINLNGSRYGRLEFRGGLVLSSPSPAFGGFSGITVDPDGKRFLAVSDKGNWLSGEIAYRGRAPVGIQKARIGPIRALGGRPLGRRDFDAESVAPFRADLAKGKLLVGFERNHRIGIFPVVGGALEPPVRYLKLPAEARRMKFNRGFEAVAVLEGGRYKGSVVAFSERYPGTVAEHTGWIWVKDQPHKISLIDHGEFEITDAASLPDGSLVVLERRFRWTEGVKMRLRLIETEAIKPGAVLDGTTLIAADLASEIDNMEGLAVHRGPSGEIVLTLLSDNNFNNLLQRNLLLQFTLHGDREAAVRD